MVKCGQLMYEEIGEVLAHELEQDRDEQDFLLETTLAAKQLDMNIFNINRCGAHTLALAIEDALKRYVDSKKTLDRARRVVKKLRTPNLMLKLRERGASKPILDVTIRWGSTYDMLERLLVLKPIIHDFGTFNENIALIEEEEWVAIEQLKKDMEAPRNATTRIQGRLITAGALLAEWELMEFLCQGNEGSYFSLCLKETLHARKNLVVENNAFLGAVYVDLRYHRLLSPEQRERAKKHLFSTWQRIVLEESLDKPQTEDCNSSTEDMYSDFVARSNLDDPLEALLVQKDNQVRSKYRDYSTSEIMIEAIEGLSNAPRLPKAEDIIKYWANHSNQDLRQLCLLVIALPVTQVSVERTFSGLKYILNNLRMKMAPEVVDAIMLLRCNL